MQLDFTSKPLIPEAPENQNQNRYGYGYEEEAPPSSSASHLEVFCNYLNNFLERARELNVGERIVFSGGWMKKSGGHAIFHVLERSESGYGFTVCNSGNGLQYHPSSTNEYPKTKFITSIHFPDLAPHHVLDEGFWYMVFKLRSDPQEENTAETFYEIILPHLANGPIVEAFSNDESLNGDYESMQCSGTCFFRCVLCALRYLLKRDGFDKDKRKILLCAIRTAFLDRVERDMDRVMGIAPEVFANGMPAFRFLNDSDLRLIDLACGQTSLATVKLQKKSVLHPSSVQAIYNQICRIQARLEKVGNIEAERALTAARDTQQGESGMKTNAVLVPFFGFERIADPTDADQYSGGPKDAAPELFVNLLRPDHPITNLEDAFDVIHDCLYRCDSLRSKAAVTASTIAIHQILCMVEHVFNEILPLPMHPALDDGQCLWFNPRDSNGNPWTIPRSVYRLVLEELSRIMQHYTASVFSAAIDKSTMFDAMTTFTSIFVIFDRVFRLPCEPKSPIYDMFTGGETGEDSPLGSIFTSWTGRTYIEMTCYMQAMSPKKLHRRRQLANYINEMLSFPEKLFDWGPPRQNAYNLKDGDPTLTFVRDLVDKMGWTDRQPPRNELVSHRHRWARARSHHISQHVSDLERYSRWLCSPWTEIPEFQQFRDIQFLYLFTLQSHEAVVVNMIRFCF